MSPDPAPAADNPSISVSPATATVPPLSTLKLSVTVTAPDGAPGPLAGRLGFVVRHGRPLHVDVRAEVGQSHAQLVTTRIDFGLVGLTGTASRQLVIRNSSASCSTPWSVRELTQSVISAVSSAARVVFTVPLGAVGAAICVAARKE